MAVEISDQEKQYNFNQQAALIYYIEEILNKWNEMYGSGGTSGGGAPVSFQNRQYQNFVTIRSQPEVKDPFIDRSILTPLNLNSLINKDVKFGNFFNKFPQPLRDSITCNIELYKTFIFGNKEYDWKIPFSKGETFDFSTGKPKTSLEIKAEKQAHTYHDNNVAISSFTFEYKGINEFDISTNLEATLELVFDNPNDLVNEISTINESNKDFFLTLDQAEGFDGTFRFSDLISNVPNEYDKSKTNLVDYRIKAVVNFFANESEFNETMKSARAKWNKENVLDPIPFNTFQEFEAVLQKCSVILYLIPHSHDVTITTDNKLSVKINYVASQHGLMNSEVSNVLAISPVLMQIEELKNKLEEKSKLLQEKKENSIKNAKLDGDQSKSEEKRKAAEEQFKKDNKDLFDEKENLEQRIGLAKYQVYSEVINQLIDNNLYMIKVPNESLGLQDKWIGGLAGAAQVRTAVKNKVAAKSKKINYFSFVGSPAQIYAPEVIADSSLNQDFFKNLAGRTDLKEKLEEAKKLADSFIRSMFDLGTANTDQTVLFVFLGDVLDTVFRCLRNIYPPSSIPRIFLGSVQLAIPNNLGDISENLKKSTFNIADIPINFTLLTRFWSSMVESKPDTITIHTFLYELIERLLRPVLGPEYFEEWGNINNKIKIGSLAVNLPNGPGRTNIFTDEQIVDASLPLNTNTPIMKGPISKEYFKEGYKKAIDNFKPFSKEFGISNYIFIFDASTHYAIGNNGDEEKDLKDGIYHLTLNTGSSLIKRLNFSRLDMPGVREGLAVQEGTSKSLLSLKQAYKIEVDLLPGLTIYKPGDVMFVRPYVFENGNRGGKMLQLPDTLGLIGYYLITSAKYNWGKSNPNMSCTVSGKLIAWISDGKSVSVKGG